MNPKTQQVRVTVPIDWDESFIQGMADRMAVSHHKYGKVEDGYPHKIDALVCLAGRLEMYHETRNTEYLIDAANFAMIEFMRPRYHDAFFEGTDDAEGSCLITVHGDKTILRHEDTTPTGEKKKPSLLRDFR